MADLIPTLITASPMPMTLPGLTMDMPSPEDEAFAMLLGGLEQGAVAAMDPRVVRDAVPFKDMLKAGGAPFSVSRGNLPDVAPLPVGEVQDGTVMAAGGAQLVAQLPSVMPEAQTVPQPVEAMPVETGAAEDAAGDAVIAMANAPPSGFVTVESTRPPPVLGAVGQAASPAGPTSVTAEGATVIPRPEVQVEPPRAPANAAAMVPEPDVAISPPAPRPASRAPAVQAIQAAPVAPRAAPDVILPEALPSIRPRPATAVNPAGMAPQAGQALPGSAVTPAMPALPPAPVAAAARVGDTMGGDTTLPREAAERPQGVAAPPEAASSGPGVLAPASAASPHHPPVVPEPRMAPAVAPMPQPAAQVAQAAAPFLATLRPEQPGRLSIRLDPADLGQVEVRVEPGRAGQARVEILVERADTMLLMQRDQHELLRALDRAGFSTSEPLSFGFAHDSGADRHAAERQARDRAAQGVPPESGSDDGRAEDVSPAASAPSPARVVHRTAGRLDLIA